LIYFGEELGCAEGVREKKLIKKAPIAGRPRTWLRAQQNLN